MKYTHSVLLGNYGENQIHRRQAMVTDLGKLMLRIYGSPLDPFIHRQKRQAQQLSDQFSMVIRTLS